MAPPRPQENGDVHENGHLELPPRHENGNGAVPSFYENGDAALPPRYENGDVALPPRYENGDVANENGDVALRQLYVRPWYENGDVELPAEDEDGNVALQPGENEVSRVVDYALQEWLPQHMGEDCETDAVFEEDLFRYPQGCRCPPAPEHDDRLPEWPLHFQSVTRINGRRYLMQLEKVPFEYSMHKLLVRSLPFADFGIVTNDYLESHENPNGAMSTIYRLTKIVSVDQQYLVRLEITRVTSLHHI